MNIQLSNIEISSIFWVAIVITSAAIAKQEIRSNLLNVLKCFLNFSIISVILSVCMYVFIATKCLEYFSLWNNLMLKETLVWTFTGTLLAWNAIGEQGNFSYKKLIENLFKFSIVWSVIAGAYNFNIWVAIIGLPILAVISMTYEFAKGKKELKPSEKLSKWILTVIGLWMASFVISNFIQNWHNILTMQTFKSTLLPIFYTIGICPLLFCWAVISSYQSLFVSLYCKMRPEKWYQRAYLKLRIILHCHSNLKKVELFRNYYSFEFVDISAIKEINIFFDEFIRRSRLLPFDKNGFDINKALKYLEKEGFKNGLYKYVSHCSDYGDYTAGMYKKISKDNSMEYYVVGTQKAVKSFGLNLSLHWNDNYQNAIREYAECLKVLCRKSLDYDPDINLLNNLTENSPIKIETNNYILTFSKTIYSEYAQGIKFELTPKAPEESKIFS